MIDTHTREIKVIVISSREKEKINTEIVKNMKFGTKIITDGYDGCNRLSILGYKHEVLNKKKEGLGKGKKVMSNIESVWNELKQYAGIYSKSIPSLQA